MQTKYYRVTRADLIAMLDDYSAKRLEAVNALLRFSRRQGGSRTRFGSSISVVTERVSIVFTKEPDKTIWKRSGKDSNEFWEPKASRAAAAVRKEFLELEAAFPNLGEIRKAIGIEGIIWTGRGFIAHRWDPVQVGGKWVIRVVGEYEPCVGLQRISDVEWEKMISRDSVE